MMSVQPSSVMHWKMVSSARGIESKVVNLPARARNDETSDRSEKHASRNDGAERAPPAQRVGGRRRATTGPTHPPPAELFDERAGVVEVVLVAQRIRIIRILMASAAAALVVGAESGVLLIIWRLAPARAVLA